LENNPHNIKWFYLCQNPNAIPIIEKNMDKVEWAALSSNPNATHLLEKNIDKVDWHNLSCNPNAVYIFEKTNNVHKIHWDALSKNPSPDAIRILSRNIDKVNWFHILSNPAAISIIENNIEYVEKLKDDIWPIAYNNNAIHLIFQLETNQMREKCKPFAEELVKYVFHPQRVLRMSQQFEMYLDEYFEMI
jgi:hypothetical protein